MTVYYPEFGDFCDVAADILGTTPEQIARLPNAGLGESALAAPRAGFGDVEVYPLERVVFDGVRLTSKSGDAGPVCAKGERRPGRPTDCDAAGIGTATGPQNGEKRLRKPTLTVRPDIFLFSTEPSRADERRASADRTSTRRQHRSSRQPPEQLRQAG